LANMLMRPFGVSLLCIFVSASPAMLVHCDQPQRVTGENQSKDAPTHNVTMSELQSTAVVAALHPRVDVGIAEPHEPAPETDSDLESDSDLDREADSGSDPQADSSILDEDDAERGGGPRPDNSATR